MNNIIISSTAQQHDDAQHEDAQHDAGSSRHLVLRQMMRLRLWVPWRGPLRHWQEDLNRELSVKKKRIFKIYFFVSNRKIRV